MYDRDMFLQLRNIEGYTFDLQFKYFLTVLYGNSATGKSYLVDLVNQYKVIEAGSDTLCTSALVYDASVISDLSALDKILQVDNRLIILDNADVYLPERLDIAQYISNSNRNLIVVMSRSGVGLSVSPYHYAQLVQDGKDVKLLYFTD